MKSALDSHLGNLAFNPSYRWNIQVEDFMFFSQSLLVIVDKIPYNRPKIL